MHLKRLLLGKTIETVWADLCLYFRLVVAGDEFGPVSNEELVKVSFVIRDHQYIELMRYGSMFGGVQWKDFFIFKNKGR